MEGVTTVTLDCNMKSFVVSALKESRDSLMRDEVKMRPALR